ncbi:Protein FAR-RED IMPAIRED RESPONSE 1 [Bienertia sinuspersici]
MSNATSPRSNLKSDYKALLHVKRYSVGKWYVHEFLEEHNHELLPDLSIYFPCHRNLSSIDKRNIDTLNSVGIHVSKRYATLGRQYDGLKNASTLQKSSPFELQAPNFYTHEMFKKFQFEIFGASGCYSKRQDGDENEMTFKYKGFLCRHCLTVLYNLGVIVTPSYYLSERWSKNAITSQRKRALQQHVHSKEERYNVICLLTEKINTEASFCDESYDLAYSTLEVLQKCVSINNNEKEARRSNQKENHTRSKNM